MQRALIFALGAGLLSCVPAPAYAEGIDILRGQFAFNWHIEPGDTKCAEVDDAQFALFKSDKYQCNLEAVTNTASDEPARVCTEKGDGAEYLIFASMKACELERTTQASNAE